MKSLNNALNLFDLIMQHARPDISTTALSEISGMNKPSISRICSTLVRHGFLAQKKKRGKYSIGPIFTNYIQMVNSTSFLRDVVRHIAIPHLDLLSNKINELVTIAFPDGTQDIIPEKIRHRDLFKSPSQYTLQVAINPDIRPPFYSTSLGKIFLSALPEKELENYFDKTNIVPCTLKTIIDINALRKHLVVVKRENKAVDDEESNQGVRSIAVGIKDKNDSVIAAICITGPSIRLTNDRIQELASILKVCANEITQELDSLN